MASSLTFNPNSYLSLSLVCGNSFVLFQCQLSKNLLRHLDKEDQEEGNILENSRQILSQGSEIDSDKLSLSFDNLKLSGNDSKDSRRGQDSGLGQDNSRGNPNPNYMGGASNYKGLWQSNQSNPRSGQYRKNSFDSVREREGE
jgi:hypothetical protein